MWKEAVGGRLGCRVRESRDIRETEGGGAAAVAPRAGQPNGDGRTSPILVDPAAPGSEVLRATLVGDVVKRPYRDFVVHRNGDDTNLSGVLVLVPKYPVSALPTRQSPSEPAEYLGNLPARERRPDHTTLLQKVGEWFGVVGDFVGIEADLT